MFRIGFILFTIINAHTLARHTTETSDLIPVGAMVDVVTTNTTPKNIEAGEAVTAIAETQRAIPSWWSNMISGVIPAYRKLTYYTGPYLLPGLVTSVIGVVSTLVCAYTSVCSTFLSMLSSNTREIRTSLVYALLPYISPDNLNCLTSTVQNAVDKFSDAQKDKKID